MQKKLLSDPPNCGDLKYKYTRYLDTSKNLSMGFELSAESRVGLYVILHIQKA